MGGGHQNHKGAAAPSLPPPPLLVVFILQGLKWIDINNNYYRLTSVLQSATSISVVMGKIPIGRLLIAGSYSV